jgi:hypothetical protein
MREAQPPASSTQPRFAALLSILHSSKTLFSDALDVDDVHGIVGRDIKPAIIFVTKRGPAKRSSTSLATPLCSLLWAFSRSPGARVMKDVLFLMVATRDNCS